MSYRKIKPIIGNILIECPDGLTINELIVKTGVDGDQLRRVLKKMDNVYIDRWIAHQYQRPAQAVYCMIKIPEDCPRPSRAMSN